MFVPHLQPPFPIRWGFTTRLEDPSQHPPRRLKQIHGTLIHEASDEIRDGDGLWTMRANFPIGVRVADCTPVLLAGLAKGKPWVAALHAGWRSTVGGSGSGDEPGILRRAVSVFMELGGYPGDLFWALGPAIQQCHFEVGPEVIEAARKDAAWRENLQSMGPRGKAHFDLSGFLRAQAHDLGLEAAKDASISRCTVCEPEHFFSFRRGDMEGRQWGWIEILER